MQVSAGVHCLPRQRSVTPCERGTALGAKATFHTDWRKAGTERGLVQRRFAVGRHAAEKAPSDEIAV